MLLLRYLLLLFSFHAILWICFHSFYHLNSILFGSRLVCRFICRKIEHSLDKSVQCGHCPPSMRTVHGVYKRCTFNQKYFPFSLLKAYQLPIYKYNTLPIHFHPNSRMSETKRERERATSNNILLLIFSLSPSMFTCLD